MFDTLLAFFLLVTVPNLTALMMNMLFSGDWKITAAQETGE